MSPHEHPRKGWALLLPRTGAPRSSRTSLGCGSHPEPGSGRELSSPCEAGGPHPQEAMDFIFIFSVCSIKLGKPARADLDERTRPGKARIAPGAQLGERGPGAAENVSGRAPSPSPSGGLKPAHVGSSFHLPHAAFLHLSISPFPFNFLFPFSISPFHFPFSLCVFHFPFQFILSLSFFPSFLSSFFPSSTAAAQGPAAPCAAPSVSLPPPLPVPRRRPPCRGSARRRPGERW